MTYKANFLTILLFSFLISLTNVAADETVSNNQINSISIKGVQRIEPETILSYLRLREGDVFSNSELEKSLKILFATGLFNDVSIELNGNDLVIRVDENPVINRVYFEGNKLIKNDTLDDETALRPRVIYRKTRVENDVERILALYRHQGRFAATIEPKIIQLEQNRVDLVFEINEGEPTLIQNINFTGNKRISDSTLKTVIYPREEGWCWSSTRSKYDPEQMNYDKESLRKYYMKNGFADVKISEATAKFDQSLNRFSLHFGLDEGKRYKLGKIKFINRSNVKSIDLKDQIKSIKPGEWYNSSEIDDVLEKIHSSLVSQSYIPLKVSPIVQRFSEQGIIDINFEVSNAPRIFIERINIKGNVRTQDSVIRRQFKMSEGDILYASELRRTVERIYNLDYFSSVSIDQIPGDKPDRVILEVDVVEKSTGAISGGAGFSTDSGLQLEASLKEKNLLGEGTVLLANLNYSKGSLSSEISYTDPYFFQGILPVEKMPGKWGAKLGLKGGVDWLTILSGLEFTIWAGLLHINMPIILLILLKGAYFSYLWSGDTSRVLRNYRQTLELVKMLLFVQFSYFIFATVFGFVTDQNVENIDKVSKFVCA